jgi:hypothetical protein
LELRNVIPAAALAASGILLATGCGGTLEGKYRRGEITTSTTGGTRVPGTSPTTASTATTTTSTTVPTAGNAAGQGAQGESSGLEPGGTIVSSAAWRNAVLPLGGRHR